jgi:hypothetical protein
VGIKSVRSRCSGGDLFLGDQGSWNKNIIQFG